MQAGGCAIRSLPSPPSLPHSHSDALLRLRRRSRDAHALTGQFLGSGALNRVRVRLVMCFVLVIVHLELQGRHSDFSAL